MSDPVITTVIPTFRRPRLLRRAIESVLAQSFKNVRICVYDNASGDETQEMVAQYARRDDRVAYFKNRENIGPTNNMVRGVEGVTTEYYSLLSDDDFLLPDFYRDAIRAFQTYPQARFVCAKTIVVDLVHKRALFRNKDWQPGFYQPSNEMASRLYRSHFTQTGVLLHRDVRRWIGPFEKSGDDRLYTVMAGAAFPFAVLGTYGAVFTIHPQACSVAQGLRQGDPDSACESLLSTVGTILALEIPGSRKVHLLLLVFRAYGATFDLSRLRTDRRRDEESAAAALPSCTTFYGLLARTAEKTPKRLYPVVRYCINTYMRLQDRKAAGTKGHWSALPREAHSFFTGDDWDVARFLSTIQGDGVPDGGIRQDAHV